MSQGNWQNRNKPVRLTKREIEVLSLIAHLANIYEKLNVNNRVKAFRRAAQMGLIPVEAFFGETAD